MPSVNNMKTDKNASSEASDPLRQAIVMVEHKIRNLEKRKAKLDSYRETQGSGKTLSRDIMEAVAKYDEVIHQLEMSREYVKQFTAICIDNDKARKKAAKKEALERTVSEVGKIKQVLLIQDVLTNMGTEQAREDFMAGQNGALKLTEEHLKNLDDLYVEVSPKHEGPVPFATQVQKAAEYLLGIVDGKSKEVAGTTCAKLQALVNEIQGCGYFEQPAADAVVEGEELIQEEVSEDVVQEVIPQQEYTGPLPSEVNSMPAQQVIPQEAPNAMAQPQGHSNSIPQPMHPLLPNIVPVSQVESNIYNAQGFKPPNANPQTAPLNDVMSRVGGNFTFFQDSELELADMPGTIPPGSQQPPPTAIPSRTFTNQNFNGRSVPAAPMGFQPAPANPYYVGGFQPQAPPHFSQDLMQGYAGAPQGQNIPPAQSNAPNNVIPVQNPAGDSSNLGYSQPAQHIPNAYSAPQTQVSSTVPAASVQQQQSFTQASLPVQTSPVVEETAAPSEATKEDAPQQEWSASTERVDWAEGTWSEWSNPPGTENGTKGSGSSKPRGDRPRGSYQGNRNGSRTNNYSNNRPPRNRERESNGGGNYYNNNTNGYQPRGDGQSRDNRDNNKDSSYRRGGPSNRGPRPDRADSRGDRGDRPFPPRDGAPRNNSGPRPPRSSNFRGHGGPRQDSFSSNKV